MGAASAERAQLHLLPAGTTPEVREQIKTFIELRKQGLTDVQIAEACGVGAQYVRNQFYRARQYGLEVPPNQFVLNRKRAPRGHLYGGKKPRVRIVKKHTQSFAEAYELEAMRLPVDCCPIEAGLILRLADHECTHGYMPGDGARGCDCFGSAERRAQ